MSAPGWRAVKLTHKGIKLGDLLWVIISGWDDETSIREGKQPFRLVSLPLSCP
jgi:hypothetical protein